MIKSFFRAAIALVAASFSLFFSTGCGGQNTGLVPTNRGVGQQARILSTVVKTAGRSYVVDEMYTPEKGQLFGLVSGPNGKIWYGGDTFVGSATMDSIFSVLPIAGYQYVNSIAAGPDQNLWLTLDSPTAIGRLSPRGALKVFPLGPKLAGGQRYNFPLAITNGPSNSLWFITSTAKNDFIVQISTSGAMTAHRLPTNSRAQWMAFGKDGNLWFTDFANDKIGKLNPNGALTEYSVTTLSAGPLGICQGPDGNMWFVEYGANKVGSITASGTIHEYRVPTPASGVTDITAGSDGALWFTEELVGKIGRITTSGSVAELPLKSAYPRPYEITSGSDKNVWFTEPGMGLMGRVDLNEVAGSDPAYSSIVLSLTGHPELGSSGKFPLKVAVEDLQQHTISGKYPTAVRLTTTDPKETHLTTDVVESSNSGASIRFFGHYTDATIAANANGGGVVTPVIVLPSAPREKPLPAPGYGLTAGARGSLWICLQDGSIARYVDGKTAVFKATNGFTAEGCSMVEAHDGNVWFTDYSNKQIGKITPQGKVTFRALGVYGSPISIALGSDGALWFTEQFSSKIGRLTTTGELRTFKSPHTPLEIVSGPDGNLWYSDTQGDINRITTSGKITRVKEHYELGEALASAFGHIWFYDVQTAEINEMTTSGTITATFKVPSSCGPSALTAGPENSLWLVDSYDLCVGRMTLTGTFYTVPTFSQSSNPGFFTSIVEGPNGNMWFTESGTSGLGWIDPKTI